MIDSRILTALLLFLLSVAPLRAEPKSPAAADPMLLQLAQDLSRTLAEGADQETAGSGRLRVTRAFSDSAARLNYQAETKRPPIAFTLPKPLTGFRF